MRLSSVGPFGGTEAPAPERTDPPVQRESVPQPEMTQIETESQNTNKPQMTAGNLTNLIEEAKKRADARKRKGSQIKRKYALEVYYKVENFEDMLMEKGVKLDESS